MPARRSVLFIVILLAAGVGRALDRTDLLFYASLDGHAPADYARGPAANLPGYDAEWTAGMRGQAALVGPGTGRVAPLAAPIPYWLDIGIKESYTNACIGALRYAQADNLRWQEGTLSFWMKARNWDHAEGKNRFLAHLRMQDTLSFIYSPYSNWVEYRQGRSADPDTYKKFATYPVIPNGTWRNITVCWRGQEQWLYHNGILRKHATEGVPGYRGSGESFGFGESAWSEVEFDEPIVLGRAVTGAEAMALVYRTARSAVAPVLAAPHRATPPTLDGKLGAGEYDSAARLIGWTDDILGIVNDDPTEAYVSYDDAKLYVTFRWPVPEKFRVDPVTYIGSPVRMKAEGRDADLSGDDHFTVTLSPPGSDDRYTFAINAAGARTDARNGDRAWNGEWQYQTQTDDNEWVLELAFPWATLGRPTPRPGERWGMNLAHRAVHVIDCGSTWAYLGNDPAPLGDLVFCGNAPFVRVAGLTPPTTGSISADLDLVAGKVLPAGWQATLAVDTTCLAELNPDDADLAKLDPAPPPEHVEAQPLTGGTDGHARAHFVHTLSEPLAADLLLVVTDAADQVVFRHRLPFVFSVLTKMDVRLLPTAGQALVEFDLGSSALVEQQVTAAITVVDAAGTVVKETTMPPFAAVNEQRLLAVADLVPGTYTLRAALQAGGRPLTELDQTFAVQAKPEWYDTNVGETDAVLDPWTPLEYGTHSVTCWGRTYTFGESLFPTQIDVLGQPLLAAPMRLTVDDRPAAGVQVAIADRGPESCVVRTGATYGDLRVTTDSSLEYDGFIWVKLTLAPVGDAATVSEVALDVPYRRAIATHWYNGQYRPDSATGYLPTAPYTCPPANFARVGDAERGLQWCWEQNYTWRLDDPDTAMELLPDSAELYRARLKFVDHEVTLTQPLTLEFGLQALPCRPPPKGYHGPYWGGNLKVPRTVKEMPMVSLWSRVWWLWNCPNTPDEMLDRKHERMARDWTRYKLMSCWYSNHTTTSPMSPEYRYYYEEWRTVPSGRPDFKALDAMDIKDARMAHSAQVCFGSESYQDWYCYYLDKALRRLHGEDPGIPLGLYYDNAGPTNCANPWHDHGVLVDGERQPVIAILAYRRMSKRLRKILKDVTPESYLTVHMSGRPAAAFWGFYDIMIPGEQYAAFFGLKKAQAEARGEVWPYDYTKMTELDRVRAEYSSQGYGPAQVFLSELWKLAKDRPAAEQAAARRHLLGMLFVNDVRSWGNDSAKLPVLEALWRETGWDDDTRFIPYWRNQQYLHMQPYDENKIVASIFERHGKAAIFAFNNTDEPVQASFDLQLAELGIAGYENGTLTAPIVDETYPIEGTRATVTLPPRDFRLLFIHNP